jgi:methyl-accepting chemotaxis protein
MSMIKNLSLRARFAALAFLLTAIIALESGIIIVGSSEISDQTSQLNETTIPLLKNAHRLKLSVVQVQQWLTDISATRGLDGLNDGFDEAENNAQRFRSLIDELKTLDPEHAGRYQAMLPVFDSYYEVGKKMAQAYVDEGPEGGNKMMANFDEVAAKMGAEVDGFLADIEEQTAAALAAQEASSAATETAVSIGSLILLLGVALVYFLMSRALACLPKVVTEMQLIADDKLDSVIEETGCQDEIGRLLQALKTMQTRLRERTESERQQAAEINRIKVALDNVSANVMVSDADNNIVYLNRAVQNLFTTAQDDIRKQLPNFDASNLLNSNIDQFHKDPEHQRRLITALTGRHSSSFEIGGRTLNITANPVVDENGERLGTAVEWLDRTKEVAIEEEIDIMVTAAKSGDLKQRIALSGKEGFYRQLAEGFNELIDVIEAIFGDIAKVMGAVAKGDISQPITSSYKGTYRQIKDDVNTTLANLEDIILRLRDAADMVANGSEEITSGNTNLSARTEEQASSLEETASSMEELTGTVRSSADNAQQANQLSTQARQSAEKGGEVVSEAISAMAEINAASKKIADIIGVIDEIAFQTNLLALNASVEAARAGEQGRGFAVVASEVRNLAGRSATAAKEIKDLIQDSVTKVEAGSTLVAKSGENLEEIVGSVKRVGDIISDIAAASSEQTAGIDQVNQAVTNMDEATQQNAALAEQTSAAAASLTEKAKEVNSLTGFFTLRSNAGETWDTGADSEELFDFAAARVAHMAWRQRIRDFLDGKSTLTEAEAVSHKDCMLGKWYYGSDGGLANFGHIHEMQEIEDPHAQLHGLIRKIVQQKNAGQNDEVERLYQEIEPLSHKIIGLLKKVEKQVG